MFVQKSSSKAVDTPSSPVELERLRQQTKHRFIGAVTLFLLAAIALPWVFAPTQPTQRGATTERIAIQIPPPPTPSSLPDSTAAQTAPIPVILPTQNAASASATHATANATSTIPEPTPTVVLPNRDPKGRFVVQAGAFFEKSRVAEVRYTLQKAGLDSYTQVITTPEGKRTRIRVGPYATREQAQTVSDSIQPLGLEAAVLKL